MMAKPGELGNRFGRPDVERIGLFSEMPYMNGKGYVPPFGGPRPDKGRNILGEGPKTKTARQDCYFDKDFKRLFVGEAGRRAKARPSRFPNVSERPFVPPGGAKLHSTPGDHYGCFGRVEAMSNKRRPRPPHGPEGRNVVGGPGKMGGPGYVDICLNPYPAHTPDRYGAKPQYKAYGALLDGPMVTNHHPSPFFDPNPYREPPGKGGSGPTYVRPREPAAAPLPPGKMVPTGPGKLPGGCHAGTFDKYPEHLPDRYSQAAVTLKGRVGGGFYPQSAGEKSFYTCSVINENLRFRVNQRNQDGFRPTFVRYLVD